MMVIRTHAPHFQQGVFRAKVDLGTALYHQVQVDRFGQSEIDGRAAQRIGAPRRQTILRAQEFYRLLDGVGQGLVEIVIHAQDAKVFLVLSALPIIPISPSWNWRLARVLCRAEAIERQNWDMDPFKVSR
jgi:hypothetical protein